jgi:putative aldouronate transport system substrate-binding protein
MTMNQTFSMNKVISGMLAVLLIAFVFVPATVTKADENYDQLSFYYPGYEQIDQAAVEEQMNKILREKIGAELTLFPLDWASVDDNLNLAFAAGIPMDIVFSAAWLNEFTKKADKGNYLELTDLINEHAPSLKEQMNALVLSSAAYKGKLYAIPNGNYSSSWTGLLLNEALVKKHKFDISKIKKLADIEPMLKIIKQKEKNVLPIYGRVTDFENSVLLERIGMGTGVLMPNKGNKVVNLYDTPEMKAQLNLYYNWTKKGYIVPSKQATDASGFTNNSGLAKKTFAVVVGNGSEDLGNAANLATQLTWKSIPLRSNYFGSLNLNGSMLSIPASSQNPEKAMQLIELFHTDKELLNLLYWGIEGEHYNVTDAKKELIALTSGGYVPYINWMVGNPAIALRQKTDPNYKASRAAFEKSVKSPVLGLYYDTNKENAVKNSSKLILEYVAFVNGMNIKPTEPTKAIAALNKKLSSLGMASLISENQRQVDEFLKLKQ